MSILGGARFLSETIEETYKRIREGWE